MTRSAALRLVVIGLSLANLLLLEVWTKLLSSATPLGYVVVVERRDFAVAMLSVVSLGLAFAGAAALARRSGHRVVVGTARITFLATILLVAEALRRVYQLSLGVPLAAVPRAGTALVIAGLGIIAAAAAIARWRVLLSHAYALVLLVLAPACLLTFARAGWNMATIDFDQFRDRAPVAPHHPSSLNRVVVVLFDELDPAWAFARRPSDLPLPELDRFRGGATYAGAAVQPSRNTIESIPSYLVGRRVEHTAPSGPRSVYVDFGDGEMHARLDTLPTLFTRASSRGGRVGVVGGVIPYCRMGAGSFSRCSWVPAATGGVAGPSDGGWLETWRRQLWNLAPWSVHGFPVDTYQRTLASANAMVADSSLDLVWIHFSIPHAPAIYDRQRRRLTPDNRSPAGYFDNLALVDTTLGMLRASMERAGLWSTTTVILTSDHHWRRSVPETPPHVPLLVKLSGAPAHIPERSPFSATALFDLVLGCLTGELIQPAALQQFLMARH